jgi:hypothetical protein
MPRKPEGDVALTGAERQRRYMDRLRNASATKPPERDEDDDQDDTPDRIYAAYMARASGAITVAKMGYPGNDTDEIIEVAESVARAWGTLALALRSQKLSMADEAKRRGQKLEQRKKATEERRKARWQATLAERTSGHDKD